MKVIAFPGTLLCGLCGYTLYQVRLSANPLDGAVMECRHYKCEMNDRAVIVKPTVIECADAT